MVLLSIDATTADATGGEPIFRPDGIAIGQVSSGGYGYSVNQSLALAYVKSGFVQPGDTVEVAILGRPHAARVLHDAPFDPKGLRLRQ